MPSNMNASFDSVIKSIQLKCCQNNTSKTHLF